MSDNETNYSLKYVQLSNTTKFFFTAKCPPITKHALKNWILTETVPASFCLVALMGLPSSGKSKILYDMFSSAIQLKNNTVDHYYASNHG